MKSQDTPFVGGPLDGRVLPVLLGPTGHPPKTYRVPVPDAAGGPPTVLVYRRVEANPGGRLGLHRGWKYEYDPEGDRGGRLRWPWSKARTGPDATPGGGPDTAGG
ncbi:hypothetical protein [Streptomyces nodosus]|uniref:YD repeat-containing protein n=1 Tax=Streptomyces nodosus TaxID=40318 RepID=A0A0B5DMI0_9ACTN|nr:hypothetical protein [Streptomyces nodosus]AJE42500.1 hypothetical protein SNOD_22510 [Streptomyces nodosus]MBB4793813.1 hypothetical protein [Streptomyces nodosus]QEV41007.1 hypothetical protein CP978_22825 [Streptomyces nodosus]